MRTVYGPKTFYSCDLQEIIADFGNGETKDVCESDLHISGRVVKIGKNCNVELVQ